MAEEAGLDLVEVAPNADPPVCRIMDFGKYQYQQQKRESRRKKNQKAIQIKEIQLRPKTDDHHLSFKIKDARRWIADGMKVRVKMRFRGREITHPNIGRERLDSIIEQMSDIAVVEQKPNLEGYNMTMVLAPISDKK
jgi:translation initiation factor IF-3